MKEIIYYTKRLIRQQWHCLTRLHRPQVEYWSDGSIVRKCGTCDTEF